MKHSKKIAEALSHVHLVIQSRNDIHIIHTSEIKRSYRELLIREHWLQEIVRGWYLLVRPDARLGDSSAWYASIWDFLYVYLDHYYGDEYCLSAEHSLDLHIGVTIVPKQFIVMAPKGRGKSIPLPFNTSLLVYSSEERIQREKVRIRNLQIMSLPYALCKVSPSYYLTQPQGIEIALRAIKHPDELLRVIVENNFVRAAGRLVGAYRFLKSEEMVHSLIEGLKRAYIPFQETNPFSHKMPYLVGTITSSYSARIVSMWNQYRKEVIKYFPNPPGLPSDIDVYIQKVEEKYSQDAYNSLSIEGYQVNEGLIEKVRNAKWSPELNHEDREIINTLAARGYYEAFLSVKSSLQRVLKGEDPGSVVSSDLPEWYRGLFSPNVAAGIIKKGDLYGYRKFQVYIRNSRHTPFPPEVLPETMETFFNCLAKEEHAGVRAVLGHFIFVYIHPYMDGNGRIGRFLMNAMLASGGYPWTIVHLENRDEYLGALEEASVGGSIVRFTKFLRAEKQLG